MKALFIVPFLSYLSLFLSQVECDYAGNLVVSRLSFNREATELLAGFVQAPNECKGDYFGFHIRIDGNNPMLKYLFEILQASYFYGMEVDLLYTENRQPAFQLLPQNCSVYDELIQVSSVGYSDYSVAQ